MTSFAFASGSIHAQQPDDRAMLPIVGETIAPIEHFAPVARDGHKGEAYLRRPPGSGPFPAVLIIPYGNVAVSTESLREYLTSGPIAARPLATGYVVAIVNFRSRDVDPQAVDAFEDALAAFDYLSRQSAVVDRDSIAVSGCSNGGDLALEVATAAAPAAISLEEPASLMFAGVFNKNSAKQGDRFTPPDSRPISENPSQYFTPTYQTLTRAKIERIQAPIQILQGDITLVNRFNEQVLIPELERAGKRVEVETYPGESHCFAFAGRFPPSPAPRVPRPAVALDAFQDMDAFFRRHIKTQPKPIDAASVTRVRATAQ